MGSLGEIMASAEDETDIKLCDKSNVALKLTKVSGVAMWKQEIPDNCAICSQSLQEPSLEFTCGTETKAGVMVAHGYCGHVFHQDCIEEWVNSHTACPQCNIKWELTDLDPVVGFADWDG